MELVYLALPYNHKDPEVVEQRVRALCIIDGFFAEQGVHTISPILKHLVLQHTQLPSSWEYWSTFSETLLSRCSKLVVLKIPGWEKSTGVNAEILLAEKYNLLIEYIDPNSFGFKEQFIGID